VKGGRRGEERGKRERRDGEKRREREKKKGRSKGNLLLHEKNILNIKSR
jgi:hypothetical protein